jgi:hypothetical protein
MKKIILVFAIVATMFGCNLVSGNAEVKKNFQDGFYSLYQRTFYDENGKITGSYKEDINRLHPYYFAMDNSFYSVDNFSYFTTTPNPKKTEYTFMFYDRKYSYWLKDNYTKPPIKSFLFKEGLIIDNSLKYLVVNDTLCMMVYGKNNKLTNKHTIVKVKNN